MTTSPASLATGSRPLRRGLGEGAALVHVACQTRPARVACKALGYPEFEVSETSKRGTLPKRGVQPPGSAWSALALGILVSGAWLLSGLHLDSRAQDVVSPPLRATSVVQVVGPAQGQSSPSGAPASPRDSGEATRPGLRLNLNPAQAVVSGRFAPGGQAQTVRLPTPVTSRYFCLETLSEQGGLPYAVLAELELLDADGRVLDRKDWRVAYADSEEFEGYHGWAENVIDGNAATYWHTRWFNGPNHPHHLVLDLGQPRTFAGFRCLPRTDEETGRINEYRIYAGDDLVKPNPQRWEPPARCYLFAYYLRDGKFGLRLAYSMNGYWWEPLAEGRSFLRPRIGQERVIRDPFLFRDPNGLFRLVWTMGLSEKAIGYASSTNLLDWSEQRALPVMAGEPDAVHCWAPETFWDAPSEQYVVFWTSAIAKKTREDEELPDRIYATTTKDFETFTQTRLLYDAGSGGAKDPTLTFANGKYYLWYIRHNDRRLMVASGANPLGPFDNPHSPVSLAQVAGPTFFRLGSQYALILQFLSAERHLGVRFGVFTSPDLQHWEDKSSATAFPSDGNQGSVLEISGETTRELVKAGRMDFSTTAEALQLGVGDWIWTTNLTDRQTCRLWRDFRIPSGPAVQEAKLRITADNSHVVFLDGREIGRGVDANCLTDYDVTKLLSAGHHVLAVEAFNEAMSAGVLLGLRATLADGKVVEVLSDSAWKVVDRGTPDWTRSQKPQTSWIGAALVGRGGRAWWRSPSKIFEPPPLLPMGYHFWRQPWFLVLVLCASAVGAVFTIRQGMQLAVQTRANRLLEHAVEQRTEELRRSQAHLEELVVERTSELRQANELLEQDIAKREQAEEALLHARSELERVSRVTTMGELAASIAHEVNQPLAGVVTSANAALNWLANQPPNLLKTRQAMERILRDGTRAGEVLTRIRTLLKRTAPAKSRISMNQVVRDVVVLTGGELRQKNVELSVALDSTLPEIVGDGIQLQQVLLNLIMNAIDAMDNIADRRKILLIRSELGELDGKPAVSVEVSDTGVGFGTTNGGKLFEAFYTTKPEGMGMGLWISRSIVDAHGGRLTAVPNDGPGATFQIVLPLDEVQSAEVEG